MSHADPASPADAAPRAPDALAPAVRAAVFKESVDLRRPLMGQMGALGDDYDGWVHTPIGPTRAEKVTPHVEGPYAANAKRWPKSLRMFHGRFLESQSHIRWWQIPLVYVPITAALLLGALGVWGSFPALSWLPVLGYAALGVLLWTLTEYVLHRFAFHYKPRSSFGRKLHFMAHGVHHLDPWDATRLVFPPLAGIAIHACIFGLICLALPLAPAMAVMAGLVAGYITYDMTHYYTHHGRPTSRWGKFLKAYHLAHHHKDWDAMYGVSNPLWDIIFRTTPKAVAKRTSGTKAATKRRETRAS